MATGLFHRQTPDGRAAGDHVTPAAEATTTDTRTTDTRATDSTVTDSTATDRELAGRPGTTIPRRRLAGQPVPPGGAVAPVPPGGAVAPPPDATRPIDTRLTEAQTERDRAETVAERERLDAAAAETAEPVRWARTSFTATLSLIIGVCATLAALSGRLAPLAVAVGVVGLVFAAFGLTAVSRRHVTGHHVALLGLAFSIAGVVFGILAINRALPWLDGGADQAAQLRDWLNSHWSWLGRW
jgi:hypothetical protein